MIPVINCGALLTGAAPTLRSTDGLPLQVRCAANAGCATVRAEGRGSTQTCYSTPDRGAEYCDDRAVCVSLDVCLSVREHICGNACSIFTEFLCMLHMSVARFFSGGSGGVAIRYVLPVLWMASYLRISQGSSA